MPGDNDYLHEYDNHCRHDDEHGAVNDVNDEAVNNYDTAGLDNDDHTGNHHNPSGHVNHAGDNDDNGWVNDIHEPAVNVNNGSDDINYESEYDYLGTLIDVLVAAQDDYDDMCRAGKYDALPSAVNRRDAAYCALRDARAIGPVAGDGV